MPMVDPDCMTMKKHPWRPFTIRRLGRSELIISGPGLSSDTDLTFYDKDQARAVAAALSRAYQAGQRAFLRVGGHGARAKK